MVWARAPANDLLSVRAEEIGTLFDIITRPSKQHTKALPDVEYSPDEVSVCRSSLAPVIPSGSQKQTIVIMLAKAVRSFGCLNIRPLTCLSKTNVQK